MFIMPVATKKPWDTNNGLSEHCGRSTVLRGGCPVAVPNVRVREMFNPVTQYGVPSKQRASRT